MKFNRAKIDPKTIIGDPEKVRQIIQLLSDTRNLRWDSTQGDFDNGAGNNYWLEVHNNLMACMSAMTQVGQPVATQPVALLTADELRLGLILNQRSGP